MAELIETQQDAIASYSYEDLEEGFGLVTYYLSSYKDTNGESFIMQKFINFSTTIEKTENLSVSAGETLTTSTDYYSGSFTRPRLLKGTAMFHFCIRMPQGNPNYHTYNKIRIKLYHYDGSTSTQIGDTWVSETWDRYQQSELITNLNAKIQVDTGKKFKKGDQIRINVEYELYSPSSNISDSVTYGIDPQNRDGTHITPSTDADVFTQFITRIPFSLVN